MSLAIYGHLFSSYTQKVLMALYENATPFEFRALGQETPGHVGEWLKRWPLRKFPVLVDGDRTVVETSIIIEYLQHNHPGAIRLIPADDTGGLDVRLWDRFFDLYVSVPMQKIVLERLRGEGNGDAAGEAEARAMLRTAYGMAETRLAGRQWACGDAFTMADCAALPALFYADTLEPFSEIYPGLGAYYERLLARPSVVRTLDEAKPYFQFYPYKENLSARFLPAA